MFRLLRKIYDGFVAAQEARAAAYIVHWRENNPHREDLFKK